MKTYPDIDYTQRPHSYWESDRFLPALQRCVRGPERRRQIRELWTQGRWPELALLLRHEKLSEQQRWLLGRIHPALLGGQFLPDCAAEEVEIASIALQSTTYDVISIRARRAAEGIRYTIADEYQTGFDLARETSRRPLSLREMIALIDDSSEFGLTGGLGLGYNLMNARGRDRRRFRHFTSISSPYYPQLEDHYEQVFEEWVNADRETEAQAA